MKLNIEINKMKSLFPATIKMFIRSQAGKNNKIRRQLPSDWHKELVFKAAFNFSLKKKKSTYKFAMNNKYNRNYWNLIKENVKTIFNLQEK